MEKAIVFGTYENTRRVLEASGTDLPIGAVRATSGAAAGFAASFVVTPVERFKILLQTNEKKKFTRKDLNSRFLYRGLSSTFTRETPGFAIYFSIYEGLKDHFRPKMELNTFHHFAFGGLSGATAWMFIYPQDLVKTRVQASTTGVTATQVVKDVWRETGVRGFLKDSPWHYSGLFLFMQGHSQLSNFLRLSFDLSKKHHHEVKHYHTTTTQR